MESHQNLLLEQLVQQLQQTVLLSEQFPNYQNSSLLGRYGLDFVSRLEKFGVTEKGEKLVLNNWVREFASLVGDLRIHHVLTAGNAQCGKSLINTLLLVDFLVFAKLNTIWFYPSKQQVDTLVPELFGKVVKFYVNNVEQSFREQGFEVSLIKPDDRQLASRFQIQNATAIFSYASNSATNTPKKQGLASVGTAGSSFSGSLLFIDERSQIPLEAISTLPRRLDASRIPTQPIREIGTYGDGIGIEYTIARSKYHFYPHVTCDNCKKEIALNPKGCLLKKSPITGKYLSSNGRPSNWFYHQTVQRYTQNSEKSSDTVQRYTQGDKVENAYIACSECGTEISKEKRISAYFKCLNTGIKLTDYLQSLPTEGYEQIRDVVTIQLSPLLRDTKYNLASHLINTGLTTESTKDYQQQVLGCTSENSENRISIEILLDTHWVSTPQRVPDLVCCGIDQGREENYIYICKYWLPEINARDINYSHIISRTYREVVYVAPINVQMTNDVLTRYKVNFGLIDNEPDRLLAQEITDNSCLLAADQKIYLPQLQKHITVDTGGLVVEALGIDNNYFLSMLFDAFRNGLVKTNWNVHDKGIYSPARHFIAMHREDSGRWIRAKDKIDDFYFAGMFCEAAFYYSLDCLIKGKRNKKRIDWYSAIA
jgi:hypothetical protein